MICPNCAAPCVSSDAFCHACHLRLPTGVRHATVVKWCGGISALVAFLSVVLIAPFNTAAGLGATLCVAIPMTFAAACIGSLGGWIIGKLACEH